MGARGTAAVLFLSTLIPAPAAAKKKSAPEPARAFQQPIPTDQRIEHALNRLTFGACPGDADRVRSAGLKKWIDLQLHPDRIAENPVLAGKLKTLDSLTMSSRELAANYPALQMVRLMVNGSLPFPDDPDRRALLRRLGARFDRQQQGNPAFSALIPPAQLRQLRTGTPEQRLAAFLAIPEDQQDDALADLPPAVLQSIYPLASTDLRRKLDLASGPPQVVARDLAAAKLLRAIYSNRQLEEVLTDFWFNHFNVFLDKGADRYMVTAYERDVIRPRVLGKFRDLLEATAQSPAMLFYLDNWQSRAPQAPRGRAARAGLNENYGRELMELHTLGVDGGYTQKDVTEVARCFTGWTIRQPQQGGEFFFNPRMHDPGEKIVLGVKIPAGGGKEDGEKVLDILAHHPATANHISRLLAIRFVADDPPAALVDRMAHTFLKTNGDLRAVMKTMLDSKEFWSAGAYRSKMKSPFELVASAVRAVQGDVDFARNLDNQVAQLGEPLYRKLEPTGYSNSGTEWINSAGLLARMNFALNLANNRVPGVKVDPAPGTEPGEPGGLWLGAPAFQKH